jgi:hypothetical protein
VSNVVRRCFHVNNWKYSVPLAATLSNYRGERLSGPGEVKRLATSELIVFVMSFEPDFIAWGKRAALWSVSPLLRATGNK